MNPSPFAIDEEAEEGIRVLALRGELDLATAPRLSERLEGHSDAVVIDLSACEFIDSTGIAVIVRAWQRLGGGDGQAGSLLALCSPTRQVRRLIAVTGLDTTISVFDDRPMAARALASRGGTTSRTG